MNFESMEPKNEDLERLEKILEADTPEVKKSFELRDGKPKRSREVAMDKKVAQEVVNAWGAQGSKDIRATYRELVLSGGLDVTAVEDELFLDEFKALEDAGV